MTVLFIISIIGILLMLPLHFWSVEHRKLQEKYGKEKGNKIGSILGMISGWGFFIFLIFCWIAPQPRFYFWPGGLLTDLPMVEFSLNLVNAVVSSPFILIGAWLGIAGVRTASLKTSETHHPDELVTSGIYSKVRHPQYLGAILSHVGMSFLFAGLLSLIFTPLIIAYNVLTSWKEEKELVKEFGEKYERYAQEVPMFIPKIGRN